MGVYGARLHGCASARTDPCIAVDMAFNSLQSILLCESPITVHNEGDMLWHRSAPLQQSSCSAACCWWRQLWPPHDGRGDDEQKSSLHLFLLHLSGGALHLKVSGTWVASSPPFSPCTGKTERWSTWPNTRLPRLSAAHEGYDEYFFSSFLRPCVWQCSLTAASASKLSRWATQIELRSGLYQPPRRLPTQYGKDNTAWKVHATEVSPCSQLGDRAACLLLCSCIGVRWCSTTSLSAGRRLDVPQRRCSGTYLWQQLCLTRARQRGRSFTSAAPSAQHTATVVAGADPHPPLAGHGADPAKSASRYCAARIG